MDRGEAEPLAAVRRRSEVLGALCDQPLAPRDLADRLSVSRSTAARALTELETERLVERRSEGYAATVTGRVALERYRRARSTTADILEAGDVLSGLPADAGLAAAAVDGGDVVPADGGPPRPVESLYETVAAADRYRGALPVLEDSRHLRLLSEHVVVEGNPAELVVPEDLPNALGADDTARLARLREAEEFTLRTGSVPPYGLVLAGDGEPTVTLVVPSEDSGIRGVLHNDTPSAVRWARDRYGAIRSRTQPAPAAEPDGPTRDTAVGDSGRRGSPAGGDTGGAPWNDTGTGLEAAGFVRLSWELFADRPVADPTTAWRAGLDLAEVNAGYAAPRERDGERLTDRLVGALRSGTDCLVTGPPGAGKSTVCKQVACRWYRAEHGTVLYREGGRGRRVEDDDVDALEGLLDRADGHTVVVVEDAVRPDAAAAFEARRRLRDRDDVSFLFDARETEWRTPPASLPEGARDLRVEPVPPLGEAGFRRLVEQFERTAGVSVDHPVGRLREEVLDRSEEGVAAPNEVVLLLHRLAVTADPLNGAEAVSSLEEDVADAYRSVAAVDGEAALDLAVLVNALNGAGLAVREPYLYGTVDADPDRLAAAVDRLTGRMLFGHAGGYRTVHESWSVAFLAHVLEAEGTEAGRERFGRVLTALLGLADADRRGRLRTDRGDGARGRMATDPGDWAADVAEQLFVLGVDHPKLAPLYGDADGPSVGLPAVCADRTRREVAVRLGEMLVVSGAAEEAESVLETARARAAAADDRAREAEATEQLGVAARHRGAFGEARDRLEEALALAEAAGDRDREAAVRKELGTVAWYQGAYDRAREAYRSALGTARDQRREWLEATCLNNLGLVAFDRSEYDRATDYYERSLAIKRDIGDRRAVADTLNNLGLVTKRTGEYDAAREYHRRALGVARETGRRDLEARCLNNLGLLSRRTGEYDAAREYHQRSHDRYREMGDRRGQAYTLNNLGLVAAARGEFDRATDRYERSLAIKREVADRRATPETLNNLGRVARERGAYERAREYYERALEAARETGGNREDEAESLAGLGETRAELGDHERARDRLRSALETAREGGDHEREVDARYRLARLARRGGDHDRAREHLADARECLEDQGDLMWEARVDVERGRLALARGDAETAAEYGSRARERFADIGARHWEGRASRLVGRAAARRGDTDRARTRLQSALEAAEAVDLAPDALAALTALRDLDGGPPEGWDDRTQEWLRRAPRPVRARYRDRLRGS